MIVHVIDSLTAGGAERVLVELVNGLHRRGAPVGVCVTRSGLQLAGELEPGVELLTLGRARTWDLAALRRFVREWSARGARILHAHGRSSLAFCAVAKLMAGNRFRLVFHDHYGEINVDPSAPFALRVIARGLVDHYVGVAPALQRWAVERLGFAPERATVLGNAIHLRRFEEAAPVDRASLPAIRQPLVGVMVANLRPQKDHGLLFQALAASARAWRDLHLLLVGTGLDSEHGRACARMVEDLGLRDNVTFLGSRTDIPGILRTADVGLLSSRSESGPLAILEYMAAGLPFVATRTGEIAQTVAERGIPAFVPPRDVGAFAGALDTLVEMDAEERGARGERGRALVGEMFDLDARVETLTRIYGNLERSEKRRK
jgi:glycosyltransferase involved in cell wall biosynthesis